MDLSALEPVTEISPFIQNEVKSDQIRKAMVQRITDGCLITRNRSIFGEESAVDLIELPHYTRFVDDLTIYNLIRGEIALLTN